ncbi:MAG: class I SAM-dependent methyltransferase [Verrucomicrobia subdivision 3 bacterium]|nr:class I SAM-dependent methyltransferase [Limisphaerales bacterium]
MNVVERFHGAYVHRRRVEVLAGHIAGVLPQDATVLDVGSGDGRLARLIQDARPDLSIRGVDVLLRPETEIPVSQFDGQTLPFETGAIDVVMFVDVLHHTQDPLILLREASRVAAVGIVIKDHLGEGVLAAATLRFMDRVGNRRHGVALPHNYWTRQQWSAAWEELRLRTEVWRTRLGLYPLPARWIFERSLHFIAFLRRIDGAIETTTNSKQHVPIVSLSCTPA